MQRKEKDNRPLRRLVVYSLKGGAPPFYILVSWILCLETIKESDDFYRCTALDGNYL